MMKMNKLITIMTLALTTILTPVTVKANNAIHNPKAYTAIPIKAVKAKGTDIHTYETHWWVFSREEIHEFVSSKKPVASIHPKQSTNGCKGSHFQH